MLHLRQLLLLLFLSGSAALKGDRGQSRNLTNGPPGKDWGNNYVPPTTPKPPVNEEKKGKKVQNPEKQPKGKKCEYDGPGQGKDWGSRSRYLDETDEEEGEVELTSCKAFKKGGNCEALREGITPEEADLVKGSITLELRAKTGVDAVKKMEKALETAALTAAGCYSSSTRQRILGTTSGTESIVELDGLKIDGLQEVSDGCTSEYTKEVENCSQFGSSLTVYFSGDATDEHITSMMTELSGTVLEEAINGKYENFADVYWIDTSSPGLGLSSSTKSRNGEEDGANVGANVGAIVGGVIGGLAVVGAVVGGFLFYKRRQGVERVSAATASPITVVNSQDGEGFLPFS